MPGSTRLAGAHIIKVPLGADGANDTERLLSAIAEDTSIVFCCTPNGNTGGAMSPAAIRHLAERVPADVMFVVVEAYAEFDLDSHAIPGAEANALMPGAAVQFKAGIHTPSDGQAEPQKAVPAIARAAQRLGPVILTQCAVRGVERTAGRISGVVTERGAIACDAVVLAGGAWSRLFCANLGIDLPQLKLRSGALRTPPLSGGPEIAAICERLAFRRRLDGGYTIANFQMAAEIIPDSFRQFRTFLPQLRKEGPNLKLRITEQFGQELSRPRHWALDRETPFERVRILDPKPDAADTVAANSRLAELFPVVAQARAG
jgi:glycine/D-amino acid oxidase-like deaminating enzyme